MTNIRSVCIVDDSPGMRKMGASFLQKSDIEVHLAKDGYEALHVIREARPDACFIDIEMPNLDGLKLVSILRASPQFKSMPIAVLSSASSPFDVQKGLLAGADRYLTKPFTGDKIAQALADMETIIDEQ
ncbi:response regulator [Pseudomonas sp. NY15437]|uniref:response regulator n=1 Tax=unclassified Pseudomonas TaxID=196821 RepID=UPI000562A2F5|nr:response regulator [Pseudomonas sp.]MDU4254171.1 response regulator [Pseudomonas sp.]HBO6305821.1 response regulator [Pseudomonas aeruginosa]